MKEIIIQQCFLRAEQDMGKKCCYLGQIGCPILLVAQKAIMKFQFPLIFESLALSRYKNWCQMSGRHHKNLLWFGTIHLGIFSSDILSTI